jgi:septin family protein
MSTLYRGLSIDASYQVSLHLAEGFQRLKLTVVDTPGFGDAVDNSNW